MSIDENFLLNWGTKIGVQAKIDGIRPSQIEGILSSLELISDDKASLLLTVVFALRQAERLRTGRQTAHLINEALSEVYKRNGNREDARKLLGVAKWVYESLERRRLPYVGNVRDLTLNKLLEAMRGTK